MALSQPRVLYGIDSVTPYKISTGQPYGILKVVGGSTLALAGELVSLTGGSSPYVWSAQDGNVTAEMSLKVKELPSFLFNLFLGVIPIDTIDDPGNVSTLTNVKGVSVLDATTGIASVGVKAGSEADLKFGAYIVLAVSATTVDVYGVANIDFKRGTDINFINDALKITTAPLTITTATAVEVPDTGVELTGGSGAIALVVDDTATYEATPPSSFLTEVTVGQLGACVPEFGAIVTAQKQSDGSMYIFDVFRLKALGFPFGMEEKAFNEAEITATVIYDAAKDGIFKMRYVKPLTGCC